MPDVLTDRKTATPWLPYQQAWMNDDAPMKLAEKSRRIGWTYVESYDAVSRRFRTQNPRNMDYWFSSADESAAREFIEYCEFWTKLYGHVVKHFTEQVEDPETKRPATAFCVRCPNGKRITAMSSSPRRFRSKGGDVGLDEFGYHDDARAMYKAAQPVTMRGGWLRCFSTHNGEDSAFNQFCEMARKSLRKLGHDPKRPPAGLDYAAIKAAARELHCIPWKLHRVTLLDAVEQGLVENINHFSQTAFTRDEFVADCRDRCVDDDMWLQEYMCEPAVGTEALLPYELIEKCESDLCAIEPAQSLAILAGAAMVYAGMDIGRRKDLSVIWPVKREADILVTLAVKTLERTPFHIQLDTLNAMIAQAPVQRTCIDATGIGAMLAEEAARKFGSHRVEEIVFTEPLKEALAMPVRRAFEDRTIRIPSDPRIREGLHKIRKSTTVAGKLRFRAESDEAGHADEFWALALAIHAAGQQTGGWDGKGALSEFDNRDEMDRKDAERSERITRRTLAGVG